MLSNGELVLIKKIKIELENNQKLNVFYTELYNDFENENLKLILSSYHYNLVEIFKDINKRLLKNPKYIHADISRYIIDTIKEIKTFIGNMINTKLNIIEKYQRTLKDIESFIEYSGGTTIPENFLEISIIETYPIFILNNSLIKEETKEALVLRPIGNGSYAEVYSFYDKYYDTTYVLKRLKTNASEKDYDRFIREFETMKSLNSIFIAKVYKLNKEKKEYIMEYLDTTLYNYIQENNIKLQINEKLYLIRQVILAFEYLKEKNILHRDISPNNILLKIFEDNLCIKITDFGLVKLEESTLTSPDSEFRGSLNDPKLKDIGFNKYDSSYEMYALTRLIAYILTGKSNFRKIRNEDMLKFFYKGTSDNIEERFKDINELKKEFYILKTKIKKGE